jgi:hypothetical protein
MSFSTLVDRVRGEFLEMPGLELTETQAIKLWSLDSDDCRYVLDVLVAAGFLQWTTRRTVIRTGRTSASTQMVTADVSVSKDRKRNKPVGPG